MTEPADQDIFEALMRVDPATKRLPPGMLAFAREVLALRPAQQDEPVAWIRADWSGSGERTLTFSGPPDEPSVRDAIVNPVWTPLYAAPQPAPVAQPVASVRCAPERCAEDELNHAEDVLDSVAMGVHLPETAYDCLGDYITAVIEAVGAKAAPVAQPSDEQIAKLAEEIAGHLCGAYVCGRVWSAWQIGTMSEDDFTPAGESNLPDDIARAVLALRPVAQQDEPVATYTSTQATNCAGCGERKHTPLRIDAMGGYVCLTCIDQKLGALLGEFGYAAPQPAQLTPIPDARLDELRQANGGALNYVTLREFRVIARAVERELASKPSKEGV